MDTITEQPDTTATWLGIHTMKWVCDLARKRGLTNVYRSGYAETLQEAQNYLDPGQKVTVYQSDGRVYAYELHAYNFVTVAAFRPETG